MKKVFFTLITALVFTCSLSSFATSPANGANSVASASQAITSYITSITKGETALNNLVYAKDFEYRNAADVQHRRYNRKQYLEFLKHNKGLSFDCHTSFQILDEVGNTSLAKVTMQFKDFTRVDYVTLHTDGDIWKVSKVVTTYPVAQ